MCQTGNLQKYFQGQIRGRKAHLAICSGNANNCRPSGELWFRPCLSRGVLIFPPNPLTTIFGVVPLVWGVRIWQASAVTFSTLTARQRIHLSWEKEAPPYLKWWTENLLSNLRGEQQRRVVQGSANTFYKLWQLFMCHIDRLQDNSAQSQLRFVFLLFVSIFML